MNRKVVIYTIGQIITVEAALLVLPAVVAAIYHESSLKYFLITAVASLVVGIVLTFFFKPDSRLIFAKEGFVTVAASWIIISLIGAVPFYISGEIPSFFDAFFETVSGFTTTGASILENVETLSHGMLFWRSFTHWIGGMGVLVFIMAIIPAVSDRSIHILRAEMPGPIVGKIVPKLRQTAKILYLIYITMTVIEVIFLLCGNMPLFDSLVHTFGTAGTGGFGIKSSSIADYSPYLQWVITIFMFLFGVNFNLYYLILIKKMKSVLKSAELWTYFTLTVVSVAIVAFNIYPIYRNISDIIRLSAFQVCSIITTTGFSTTDFSKWPELSKGILLILMFTGACAGSTAGGLKISRLVMMFKTVRRELRHMLHPHSVTSIKFEGKQLDDPTVNSVSSYFILYMGCFFGIFLLLCLEPFDFTTNFSAVAACFNNVGPGFGLVGPAASYAAYSDFSKIILSVAMLLGRLEIYPILFALTPSIWKNK